MSTSISATSSLTKTQNNAFSQIVTNSDATYLGLHEWFCHLVKHLGWMVLCHEKCKMQKKPKPHEHAKIEAYKASIIALENQLILKLQDTTNEEKKKDLKIIYDKLMLLKNHVDYDFNGFTKKHETMAYEQHEFGKGQEDQYSSSGQYSEQFQGGAAKRRSKSRGSKSKSKGSKTRESKGSKTRDSKESKSIGSKGSSTKKGKSRSKSKPTSRPNKLRRHGVPISRHNYSY